MRAIGLLVLIAFAPYAHRMGIDVHNLEFLLKVRESIGSFGDTITLGRQAIFIGDADRARADVLVRNAGIGLSLAEATSGQRFADAQLFTRLGTTSITAADASAYEQAHIVHDFNAPIPAPHHQSYDTVIDGGTSEHIFNIPVAIANIMQMCRTGGRVIGIIPANNWLGHGLYQFSPEFVFRVFTPENGFQLRMLYLCQMDGSPLEEVLDRGAQGIRGEIGRTRGKAMIYYCADKVAHVAPFARRWPQQGDYDARWQASGAADASRKSATS